ASRREPGDPRRARAHRRLLASAPRVMEAARIADDVRAVVLVEGLSDRVAIEALAERRGRNLATEGVSVVPIGGAQAIRRALDVYGPPGLGLTLAGLCDVGEERSFRRGLEHAGL